ncbi:hypothetical protein MBLNU459_g6217t1 [Dothideomycetes sp. NU459]
MQKAISRTAAAQKHAARRAAQQGAKRANEHEWQYRQTQKNKAAVSASYVKNERVRRREAYEAGPLAPRHDVGEDADKYATADPYVINNASGRLWQHYKDEVCPFAEGDRVVMLEGRDKGRIGRLSEVNHKGGVVKVNGLNMADWHVPEYMRMEGQDPRAIVQQPVAVPFASVKLVHALKDPETGRFQDTIVDNIRLHGAGWDKVTREYKRGERFVPALGSRIPWPKEDPPAEKDPYDDDTYRIDVDAQTQRPYLLQPPMPPSVIDELRNKYSVYRTRHDDYHEEALIVEDFNVEAKQALAKTVMTPLMELQEKKKLQKLAEEKELSDEQLSKIGEVIAQEKVNAARKVAQGEQ